ncbi:hypothetical protein BKA70DRAFT_1242874 [Coprinopsis sp. MPI-PUGE-AT-0042]|nr:hypothetical protein BKA70DRAFT_1242874 [Coprinopsis sp. MPI-PUGE-AT-0042]
MARGKTKSRKGGRSKRNAQPASTLAHRSFFAPLAPSTPTSGESQRSSSINPSVQPSRSQGLEQSYAQATIGSKRQTIALEAPAESPHPPKKLHMVDATPTPPTGGGNGAEGMESPTNGKSMEEIGAMAVDDIDYDKYYDSDVLEYTDGEGETTTRQPDTPTPPSKHAAPPLAPVAQPRSTLPDPAFGLTPIQRPARNLGSQPRTLATPKPPATNPFTVSPNPFVDVDDGPLSFANHPSTTALAEREDMVYYEGDFPPHQLDFHDIMESVPDETRAEWDAILTNKVLVVFGSDRVTSNNLAKIDELKYEIKHYLGSSEGIEIRHVKLHPSEFTLASRDTFLPMLIHGLTPRQKETLVKKRGSNSNRAWLMFFDYNLPLRTLLLSISKIPIRDEGQGANRVTDGITKTLEPFGKFLTNHISQHSNRFPNDFPTDPHRRYKAWLRTITCKGLVTKVENNKEEVVWFVYMEPPHDDYNVHKELVKTIKTATFRIEGNNYFAWEDDFRCVACRGRDHMKGLCPFRALPGFFDVRFGNEPGQTEPKEPTTLTRALLESPRKQPRQYRNATPGPSTVPTQATNPHNPNLPPPLAGGYDPSYWNRGGRGGYRGSRGGRGGRGRGK